MTARIAAITTAAPGAGPALPPASPCQPWQRQPHGGRCQTQRGSVVAAAKRRGPPKVSKSSAGGGGRGRTASRDRRGDAARDRTAVRDLSSEVRDGPWQPGVDSSARPGGFGGPSSGGRRRRREGYASEAEAEGGADWDEELLEDLSDSGEADWWAAGPSLFEGTRGCHPRDSCC